MELEHHIIPYTKINSKYIEDLNIRPDTIKFIEDNRPDALWHTSQQYLVFILGGGSDKILL